MHRTFQVGLVGSVSLVLILSGCATVPKSTSVSEPHRLGHLQKKVPVVSGGKHVVVLLDASGSMKARMSQTSRSTRMDAVKTALKCALTNNMAQDVQIGLLVFGAKNIRDHIKGGSSIGWAYPLGSRNDTKLLKAIDLPIPGYKTPLGACIQEAVKSLSRQRTRYGRTGAYHLFIVTDGEADDPGVVEEAVAAAKSKGITIHVIGVSLKTHTLRPPRVHKYIPAGDPVEVKKAVAGIFAEVTASGLTATGENVFEVLVSLPDGVVAAIVKALCSPPVQQ